MTGQSGTTGILSNSILGGGKSSRKKKNAVYIRDIYLVRECIYKGHFHNTYKGANKLTKTQVMIKMCNQYHEHMNNESKAYKMVKELSCIPKVLHQGEEKINSSTYFVKVTESYGPSLKILFSLMGNLLSVSTICMFTINMLTTIEEMHKANIVHRNLRPRKIVIHNDLKNMGFFLLDLKYARKYRHKNGQIVRYTENSRLMNKVFLTPSRKDDMESLAYILIYFFRRGQMFGSTKSYKNREEKLKFYEDAKLSLVPETLAQDMPQEFISFLTYVKAMNIQDPPEYDAWKKTFKGMISKQPFQENTYEWVPRIRTEVANVQGHLNPNQFSLLQELDTPSIQDARKDSQQEQQQQQQPPLVSNKPMPEVEDPLSQAAATTSVATRGTTEDSGGAASQALLRHVTRELKLEPIAEVEHNNYEHLNDDSAYMYGAVDLTDLQQRAGNNSNITFGAAPVQKGKGGGINGSDIKSEHNNSTVLNTHSFGDMLSEKNNSNNAKSKQKSSQQAKLGGEMSDFELSQYVEEEEEEQSLAMHIYNHNRLYVVNPFAFKQRIFR